MNDFDYIITMDDENLRHVRRLGKSRAKVALLLSFVPDTEISEVPDPYFDNGFEVVYLLVRVGTEGLLRHIQRERQLT